MNKSEERYLKSIKEKLFYNIEDSDYYIRLCNTQEIYKLFSLEENDCDYLSIIDEEFSIKQLQKYDKIILCRNKTLVNFEFINLYNKKLKYDTLEYDRHKVIFDYDNSSHKLEKCGTIYRIKRRL